MRVLVMQLVYVLIGERVGVHGAVGEVKEEVEDELKGEQLARQAHPPRAAVGQQLQRQRRVEQGRAEKATSKRTQLVRGGGEAVVFVGEALDAGAERVPYNRPERDRRALPPCRSPGFFERSPPAGEIDGGRHID